jgi:probable rRNA maturation factor
MKRDGPPRIEVRNAQRTVSVPTASLRSFARIAIALTWRRRRSHIGSVGGVFVSIISDSLMAQVHKKFCGISGPTDVLTFQHGEIVISAQTAARQARRFRTSLERELRFYILHGLLHLCGYDDGTEREQATMERMQRELLGIAQRLRIS